MSRLIKAKILVDFKYFSEMMDLDQFEKTWTYGGILCSVQRKELIFSDQLV